MSDVRNMVEFDERRLDGLFEDLDQNHLPGAAVGIAVDGHCIYRKGFGLANMELPVLLSPTIKMRIGSTSKHFTSLAYMLLCEDGLAALDDSLSKYLHGVPPVMRNITIRQLMGHISGIRDVVEINRLFNGTDRPTSISTMLSLYETITDLDAPPGVSWNYTNAGYLILGVVLEGVTKERLETILRDRIFVPIGMNDTQLRRFDTDFVANSATLHTPSVNGGYEKSYMGAEAAGYSGIVSTVDDMLKWLAHMDRPIVGTAATWEIMKQPHVLKNGTSTGYGLGLITDSYRGVETLSHAGAVMGGNSQMLKVPSAGLDIVVLVNRHDVSAMEIANKIIDTCLSNLEPAREVEACGRVISGNYQSPTTGRIIQLSERDGRQVVSLNGFDWEFLWDPDEVLRPATVWSYIKYEISPDNVSDPAVLQFSDFGNTDELMKLEAPITATEPRIAGNYRCDETGTDASIIILEGGANFLVEGEIGVHHLSARKNWRQLLESSVTGSCTMVGRRFDIRPGEPGVPICIQ